MAPQSNKPNFEDIVIILPGITGSVLRKNGRMYGLCQRTYDKCSQSQGPKINNTNTNKIEKTCKNVFVSYDHSEDVHYKELLRAWDANTDLEFDLRFPNPIQI